MSKVRDIVREDFVQALRFNPPKPGRKVEGLRLLEENQAALTRQFVLADKEETLILKVASAADEDQQAAAAARMRREVTMLSFTHHPNIVRMYAHGRKKDWVLQEYAPLDWSEYVNPQDSEGVFVLRAICAGIASALQYLHEQEPAIIHNNLRPDHLRITADGDVKLLSFGGAYFADEEPVIREPDEYIAPEALLYQQNQKIRPEPAVDRYGLAVCMYYAFSGKQRFGASPGKGSAKRRSVVFARRVPLQERNERVPPRIAEVVDAMLDPRPAKRPSWADLHEALEDPYGDPA